MSTGNKPVASTPLARARRNSAHAARFTGGAAGMPVAAQDVVDAALGNGCGGANKKSNRQS
jgi:hypothetical protein